MCEVYTISGSTQEEFKEANHDSWSIRKIHFFTA